VAATGVILAAVYLLWAYQRVFQGDVDDENRSFAEMTWREGAVLAPLVGLIVFLGVYPKPVLDRMEPAVDRLITHVAENSDFVSPSVERPEPAGTEASGGDHPDGEAEGAPAREQAGAGT
jgi:NADH-quinone oxidoreductase subunit M